MAKRPDWLDDAVFYEIYPQSFKDTDGDGIGNINGITEKLPYIKELGCTAIWINPCFESPFLDAGYDVSDYCRVAPRYGTNDDLVRLFEEAHKLGMHVLLDLVPGHLMGAPLVQRKHEGRPQRVHRPLCLDGQRLGGACGLPVNKGHIRT